MSRQNTLKNKRLRSLARAERKATVAIPFGGVIVRKRDVKNHRYLRDHGLPHSPSMASVLI